MTIIKKIVLVCAAAVGLLAAACNKAQNKSSDMENHKHASQNGDYACPMHSDIKGKQGEKCPKCGMDLELTSNEESGNAAVEITTVPQKIEPGKPTQLNLTITENGKPVKLDVVHEKNIHLIIVDETLTWFDHIHTDALPNGTYTASETFPIAAITSSIRILR